MGPGCFGRCRDPIRAIEERHLSLGLIKISRLAFMYYDEEYQLHIFRDASKDAFAAVGFVRTEGPEGVSVQLLMAKSRVAPVKASTIRRLDLLGCLIGGRLCRAVTEGLENNRTRKYFWSGSSTVLAWIRRNDEWGTSVDNRVRQINEQTRTEQWRHVPEKCKPADRRTGY
jgi:hypothetical protein